MLGAIGSKDLSDVILFEVSSERVLTFRNMVRSNSVRFTTNDTLLKKPISQYVGPSLDKIRLTIILDAQWGVDPQIEYNKLIHIQRDGDLVSIIVGKTAFGTYRWRIADLSIPKEQIDNTGFIRRSEVAVSFEEYV
ncbi:MAG: phage tail protein [Oscillospiraceae bacterium]|nr:phage tail protein [Oscillospiraceae bacterium]